MRRRASTAIVLISVLSGSGAALAADLRAEMKKIDAQGTGETIGTITISQTNNRAVFTTDLKNLPPGEHGFHVHEKGECGPGPNPQGQQAAGMAAGGHWDPDSTKAHKGPTADGHKGDLPALMVNSDGTAKTILTAPRIDDISKLKGQSLMIHSGGDNYADQPQPLGGGGPRIACGIIQ